MNEERTGAMTAKIASRAETPLALQTRLLSSTRIHSAPEKRAVMAKIIAKQMPKYKFMKIIEMSYSAKE
jgi:hypothetical protein